MLRQCPFSMPDKMLKSPACQAFRISEWKGCCRVAELKNTRHEKFAQCLAKGMSQRKSYRAAFPSAEEWKDETVDSKASVLAKNGKVLERLEELAKESSSKAVMSVTERKEWLSEIIRNEYEKTTDRIKAVDTLNRMDGAYVENVKIEGQVNNPMAGLTTEELKKLIASG